uniref:Uncharacterized protein n=1 Tax=Salix viminalis TaxID=40686 RepID=A0A6N2JXH3_SALVM
MLIFSPLRKTTTTILSLSGERSQSRRKFWEVNVQCREIKRESRKEGGVWWEDLTRVSVEASEYFMH